MEFSERTGDPEEVSALPPKANMRSVQIDVRHVRITDMNLPPRNHIRLEVRGIRH
jgi:hypothetical protein